MSARLTTLMLLYRSPSKVFPLPPIFLTSDPNFSLKDPASFLGERLGGVTAPDRGELLSGGITGRGDRGEPDPSPLVMSQDGRIHCSMLVPCPCDRIE